MKKPYDIGDGYSCASLLPGGEWLAVVRPHALHGMVELTGAVPFDESIRGNQTQVRLYRASLTTAEAAFLVPWASSGTIETERGPGADGALWERIRVTAPSSEDRLEIRLDFRGRLQRPPYAEITDTAPLPPLSQDTEVGMFGHRLELRSEVLESFAEILVEPEEDEGPDRSFETTLWSLHEDGAMWSGSWARAGDEPLTAIIMIRCRLETRWDPERQEAVASPPPAPDIPFAEGTRSYILGCCALRTGPEESVFLTDHRLLPLSWTRDAYYLALFLLLCADSVAIAAVGRHLRWLWGPARSSGVWMRSHLTNGAVKDPGLQADQQLYPILELLDYRRAVGAWPTLPERVASWGELVGATLADLTHDASTGLVESEENPADDASDFPYSFSTQVLYVAVLERLIEASEELGLEARALEKAAQKVRGSVLQHFVVEGPDGTVFAYEVDGRGGSRLYGDANDLPTALAPAWGFCGDDDPVWRRTMEFTLSPANPGWSAGPFGGLGSAHTPGTWPLGDLQSYLFYSQTGEPDEASRVLARVAEIAAHDGLLPETYYSETGGWRARHWFAWPSAAWGATLLAPGLTVPRRSNTTGGSRRR